MPVIIGRNYFNSNILEMIRNELVKFNDNLYIVFKKYHEEKVRIDKVQELRELLGCDIVLKNNNVLFYCNLIPELEILEETKN